MARLAPWLCFAVLLPGAVRAEPLKNWFDDPFFAVSSAIAHCPTPLGPFMSEAERRVQAHHRAERGTTCWLAGQCDKPNDYAYDREIAEGLRAVVAANPKRFAHTSLWFTVQGRVVFIEGCVPDRHAGAALEALAMSVPNVKQAIATVRQGGGAVPYKVLPKD